MVRTVEPGFLPISNEAYEQQFAKSSEKTG
ncbi:hypothetical protein F939_01106 [Acinetobacter radioresistens DSM 6976 = NBRC 102413 = CIP 103788]|jgi:hypothetical protein|nr:hypothetical protein F940_00948 [Acinetobacter radioresistens NIPH 2130]ENV89226.1 hypothetical protein F939_01106 [Acinetobacter radioresistens DSM 6976 = NBRC 102413 = CIP 103788]